MDDPPRRQVGAVLRGVVAALGVVVLVGLLVRSPATVPDPTVGPIPSGAIPGDPFATSPSSAPTAEVGPPERPVDPRGSAWTTIGYRAPINLLRLGPGVWTGSELLVGFTPSVAAYSPDRRPREAWRTLPPHPAGALQVRGAVQMADAAVLVYGQKTCAGCPWEPALHALDPDAQRWERLPDPPGEASQDHEEVLGVGEQLVVVRDRGAAGIQALGYDPAAAVWDDLEAPQIGPLRWRAWAAGQQLLVVGVIVGSDGTEVPGAMAHDMATGRWRDVGADIPLPDPHQAAAVWTGEEGGEVVFFGGSLRDGAPRGATLSLADDTWTPLPDLPFDDQLAPALGSQGPLTGLTGVWDGERALFVGGLIVPLFLVWSPDLDTWEVRRATGPRADATAVWTGRQVLLWGGTDRRGPFVDLQAWPARPVQG